MNKVIFFIFFALFALLNSYIFIRGRQALPKEAIIQTIYTALFLFCSLSLFVAFLGEGRLPRAITAICENVGGFWMVTFLYFLAAALLADILRGTNYYFGIFPEVVKAHYALAKLLYFGFILLLLLVISIVGYVRFANPKTVLLSLDIPKNGKSGGKLNVVAVSDVHLGDMIRKDRLSKYVDLINSKNPDLILIAGDLFDRNLHTVEAQGMDSELRRLNAKFGVYAVLGNHEYFGNPNRAVEYLTRSGITVLRDTVVTIDKRFVLIGRDDLSNRHRKPLKALLAGAEKGLPTILLDHQPARLAEAVENNIDVQISGHTHNGQIYPFSLVVSRMYELAYGYMKKGNTHFYVSSGLGLWGAPIRLGTQSEIVNMKLNVIPGKG